MSEFLTMTDPNAQDPSAQDPSAQDPNAQEPNAQEPNAQEPNAQEPNAQEPNAYPSNAHPSNFAPSNLSQQSEPCWCDDLAAYALDALDEAEIARIATAIALTQDPDLTAELTSDLDSLQAAAASLAYSSPLLTPSPSLKSRLFQHLNLDPPAAPETIVSDPNSAASPTTPCPVSIPAFVLPPALNWQPHRHPGFEIAHLHTDPDRREATAFMRAVAGARFPAHRHGGPEEILMLQGDLTIGNQPLVPGTFLRSETDSLHGIGYSAEGCLFFLRTSLDNEMLTEEACLA
jgi:anti-sigma factor ChrR (cupin superfamily)